MTNDFLAHPPPPPLSLLVPLGNSPRGLGSACRPVDCLAEMQHARGPPPLPHYVTSGTETSGDTAAAALPPPRSPLNSRRWEITTGYLSSPFPP
ncbi:hypothetical protein E2C01_050888 [Portunus trituberculatus]|uniref:Uncharacterized protein n=1 Tax=Portunus trituberculatus TaxID=210409 RepID=A0A5B7GA60_PORTR|nr:hypothetical protein [Portunus trituberculatus]